MTNWRFTADLMLNRHRSAGKVMVSCSKISYRFLSSYGGGRLPYSSIQLIDSPFFGSLLSGNNLVVRSNREEFAFGNAATFLPTLRNYSALQAAEYVNQEDSTPFRLSYPYLMVPPSAAAFIEINDCKVSEDAEDYYHFFSLKDNKVVRIKKNQRLPWQKELYSPDNSWCIGSSHGWLAFIDRHDCSLFLFNPFIVSSSSSSSYSLPYVPLPSIETLSSVVGVRVHKYDHKSSSSSSLSSSSLKTEFILSKGHPSTEREIPPDELSQYCVYKLVLSSAPSLSSITENNNHNCTVVALQGENMVFCRLGDTKWTELNRFVNTSYEDVVYFEKDQLFYAIGLTEFIIEAWDLRDPSSPKCKLLKPSFSPRRLNRTDPILGDINFCTCKEKYLVESSGNLLMVIRFTAENVNAESGTPFLALPKDRRHDWPDDCNDLFPLEEEDDLFASEEEDDYQFDPLEERLYRTFSFRVYKLDFVQKKWEFVDCLGDQALFLGPNQSFSLSARDFPELNGNSIYFTDDAFGPTRDISCFYGGHNLGVYNLANGHITSCFPSSSYSWKIQPSPIWLIPNSL